MMDSDLVQTAFEVGSIQARAVHHGLRDWSTRATLP